MTAKASNSIERSNLNDSGDSSGNWFLSMFGSSAQSSSGPYITHETSQRLTAVWASIRIISETIASLSWSITEEDDKGYRRELKDSSIARLLRNPSSLMNGMTWFETMQAWATLRGNGISLIDRDKAGRPRALYCFPLQNVKIDRVGQMLFYTFFDPDTGQHIVVDSDSVIHIRALVWDGFSGWGKSPLEAHRDTIGAGLAGSDYMSNLLKNGAHIPGFLATDQKLSQDAADRMRKSWKSRYSGAANAGNTPVLEMGMKYVPLSLSPTDAKYIEHAALTNQDISRIFRVPLHMLGDLERATFSNIENQSREFVQNTIRPWVKRWESELRDKLIPQRNAGRVAFRFNLDSLLRGDTTSRAKLLSEYMKWGILNKNEARKLEGFNPTDDDEGNVFLTPVNMAPMEVIMKQLESTTLTEPTNEEE